MLATVATSLLASLNLLLFIHGQTETAGARADDGGWTVVEDWHNGLRESKWDAAIDATGNGNDEFQFYALSDQTVRLNQSAGTLTIVPAFVEGDLRRTLDLTQRGCTNDCNEYV